MRLAGVLLKSCVLLAGLNSACTFYTACPADNGNGNGTPNGVGGSGGGGGGAGGSAGAGQGGTDISVGGEAPQGEWVNETFNLLELESECGNVSHMSAKPDEDLLIISVAQHGLWAKSSDASEWRQLGQGKGSAVITNRGSNIVYDPADPQVFWQSGIYNDGGVYRTDDGGDTFVDLGLRHDDYVSVDFTDPDRQTLLASGHEMPQTLQYSDDGGETWSQIGASIPEEAHICSWPVVLDSSTFLLGCGTFGGGKGGIYRSTDVGASWEKVNDHKIFPGPLFASDGAQYWSGEVTDGIVRTDDLGLTFEGPFGKGELVGATPVELPDGRIAALGLRRILVSSDRGKTWKVVTPPIPFDATGITYSVTGKSFYAYHWTCETKLAKDAVMSYRFDYEAQ